MKALVYTQPNSVVYREEPDPDVRSGDVLIEVHAVGVCGSDLHAYLGHDPRRKPPLILGHEVSGRVVSGAERGKPVVLNPLLTCHRCEDCLDGRGNLCRERGLIGMSRPGAFAEQLAIDARNVVEIPSDMDPAHAALCEPAATALHSVRLAGRVVHRPLSEARALVIGGGAVGLLSALVLRSRGCRDVLVAETNPLRRNTAADTGACQVCDPLADPPAADSFDVVIDAVGADATHACAVEAVKSGGVICHIGLAKASGELDYRRLTLAEITLIGNYTYTPIDFRAALAALHSGALGALGWIDKRPLADGGVAMDDQLAGRVAAAKTILVPETV